MKPRFPDFEAPPLEPLRERHHVAGLATPEEVDQAVAHLQDYGPPSPLIQYFSRPGISATEAAAAYSILHTCDVTPIESVIIGQALRNRLILDTADPGLNRPKEIFSLTTSQTEGES